MEDDDDLSPDSAEYYLNRHRDEEPEECEWGCCFPGECCMPGPHLKSECHTAQMVRDFERDMRRSR